MNNFDLITVDQFIDLINKTPYAVCVNGDKHSYIARSARVDNNKLIIDVPYCICSCKLNDIIKIRYTDEKLVIVTSYDIVDLYLLEAE